MLTSELADTHAKGDQIVDLDDQLSVMIAMRDEGKIGAIGLSAVDMTTLKRALPAGIACVTNDLVDQCGSPAFRRPSSNRA